MKIKSILMAVLMFPVSVTYAEVIYDANSGEGKVGADLEKTLGWKIKGAGNHADDKGGINDGGVLAYMLNDDNLAADNKTDDPGSNGPKAVYDYSSIFKERVLADCRWTYTVKQKIIAGNGGRDGALEVYLGDNTRYVVWAWIDKKGMLKVADHASGRNWTLGKDDGKYHEYKLESDGEGAVSIYVDGALKGNSKLLNGSINGQSTYLTLGGGSGSGTGQFNIARVEFTAKSKTEIPAGTILSVGDVKVIQKKKDQD